MRAVRSEGPTPLVQLRKGAVGILETTQNRYSLQDFERDFEKHWSSIYGVLRRMVGDPAEAEDLALETFYRLYGQYARVAQDFNLAGWLFRVATNLGLQSIRGRKRRERYELAAGKGALDEAPEDRPAEIHAGEEERRLARRALAQMNPRRSQLLILRYSGLPYKEIAEALDLSPASIGPLLVRAEREFEKYYRALVQEDL
jgi:RNA polymerase sigma factor (sigma-70 family)